LRKFALCFLFGLTQLLQPKIYAQDKASIYGIISDSLDRPIEDVNILIPSAKISGSSNKNGSFNLQVPAQMALSVVFTYVGRPAKKMDIRPLENGEKFEINVKMDYGVSLRAFVVTEEKEREKVSMYTIDPRKASILANVSGSFEQILKTLPGVSSNNELSSQYNVRGGNYDENLIYVNDIEIYRPFLPRSGQQEGLSFIHTELVQNVKFSAGGFEARYGDKMSSVLDIKYKDPKKFGASATVSLLGLQTHVEGASKNLRFTWLLGARYWSNAYVLGTFDVQGDYQPKFYDVQSLLNYHITDKLSLSVLGSFASNKYYFVPQNRQTTFGTVNRAYQLNIFFDGADLMEYQTGMAAATLDYRLNHKTQLKLIASTFYSNENEIFTVEGAYRLSGGCVILSIMPEML
jgi:hypothetical protein